MSGIAPNFYVNANGIQSYGDIITMRGIANTQLFGAPGVQLYIDGVPQADVSSYGSNLYDVESIEILRGPQGYHFGKSVTGGAISKTVADLRANQGALHSPRMRKLIEANQEMGQVELHCLHSKYLFL